MHLSKHNYKLWSALTPEEVEIAEFIYSQLILVSGTDEWRLAGYLTDRAPWQRHLLELFALKIIFPCPYLLAEILTEADLTLHLCTASIDGGTNNSLPSTNLEVYKAEQMQGMLRALMQYVYGRMPGFDFLSHMTGYVKVNPFIVDAPNGISPLKLSAFWCGRESLTWLQIAKLLAVSGLKLRICISSDETDRLED